MCISACVCSVDIRRHCEQTGCRGDTGEVGQCSTNIVSWRYTESNDPAQADPLAHTPSFH